jgi:hypothetical protein
MQFSFFAVSARSSNWKSSTSICGIQGFSRLQEFQDPFIPLIVPGYELSCGFLFQKAIECALLNIFCSLLLLYGRQPEKLVIHGIFLEKMFLVLPCIIFTLDIVKGYMEQYAIACVHFLPVEIKIKSKNFVCLLHISCFHTRDMI